VVDNTFWRYNRGMEFIPFTDKWEWIFAICGLVGVGGIVAILRAIFGKPKLEFNFSVCERTDNKQQLICEFRNNPVRTLIMKLLFVKRPTIESVVINCDVFDRSYTESRVGSPFLAQLADWDNKVSKQLSVPASILPITFTLATYDKKSDEAVLLSSDEVTPLLTGVLYLIRLTAILGDRRKKARLIGLVIWDKGRGMFLWQKRIPESLAWGYDK